MMMLESLRNATSRLHKELEKENLANKIIDHSITLEEYKRLLFQNYLSYKTAEKYSHKYLPGLPADKASRIENDLQNMGVEVSEFTVDMNFSCDSLYEAIGATYVVEGSAMGGMLIGKEVKNCPALADIPPQHFFNGERGNMKSWNQFLKFIRSHQFNNDEIEAASQKAVETFELFGKAYRMEVTTL